MSTPPKWQPTYIAAYRIKKGLSQEELGALIGKTHSQISQLERGQQKYNQELLERIAPYLDASPADLIERDPTVVPPAPNPLHALVDKIPEDRHTLAGQIIEALAQAPVG